MPDFIDLPVQSQFKYTPVYRVDDTIRFGLRQTPVSPTPQDRVYNVTLETANRLDLIANAFYGNPELWWVIADANSILDPMAGIPVGTELRIPPRATAISYASS